MEAHFPIEKEPSQGPKLWHFCWQAAIGRDFLADPGLCARIRGRLLGAHLRSDRALLDYLVTPSEIHAVSHIAAGEAPGCIARAVGNVLSRWVRAAQPIRSPVLAGRYRAHPIGSDDELRHEIRMLAWRPVFLGLCSTPSHYANGGLRTSLGLTPAKGFNARPLLEVFGESIPAARASMRAWVAKRPSERDCRRWELERGYTLATGAAHTTVHGVRNAGAATLLASAGSAGVDGALDLLEIWVFARMGSPFGPQSARSKIATSSRVRGIVACLAVDHGLCSASAVARHFRRAKSTLSEQMSACRGRPADRKILATPLDRIADEANSISRTKP